MTEGLSGAPKEWLGRTVEVLTMENKLTFMGKISEFDGKVMCVEDASGRDTPSVLYNSKIKLRVFKSGGIPVVVYGFICGSSESFWKLDRLESCDVSEKREHFRHGIFTGAKLFRTDGVNAAGVPRTVGAPIKCEVEDVSAGGVLIKCRESFQEGEVLLLSELVIAQDMSPFTFACVVRRRRSPPEELDFLYGCQFEGMNPKEEDRLLKAILIDQRNNLRRERNRYSY